MFQSSYRWLLVLFLSVAALSWIPSCGFGTAGVALGMGGGGGGGTTSVPPLVTYGLTRDVNISGVQPSPGQVVAAEPANSQITFAADAVYDVTWRDSSGAARAVAKARAMTNRRLALVVPLGLAAGDYKAEFPLADGRAELVVPVGAVGSFGDPATVVASARTWWGTQRDALQASANADPDAARRARSLADLSRLSSWLTTFDAAVAGLDAESLRTLARLLDANAVLRAAEPSEPFVSVDLIAAQSAAAATLAEYGLSALAASSSAVAPAGSAAELETLLPASQMIGGLVAVLTAYDRWRKALAQPCKPIEGTLQVTAADGSALTLRFAQPLPLRCRVLCSSLIGTDAGDARVAGIVSALDVARARRDAVLPTVAQWIESLAPALPTTPFAQLTELAAQRLVLVSQAAGASGLPTLVLETGALRASQVVFLAQSATVQIVARIEESALGTAGGAFSVQLDNSPPIGLNLVVIPAGTFQMGSMEPVGQPPYYNQASSQPVHSVAITQPFWMGKCEVTQSQYQAIMGSNPSYFQGFWWPNSGSRPVEQVSWSQAVAYCDALSVQEAAAGRLLPGYEYRLPTEAEWEYSCRAGTSTEWSAGTSLVCGQASFYDESISNYCVNQTSAVGSYSANDWGLHDMHGNVWEWCLDSWDGATNYPSGAVSDPFVSSGPSRVFRGGAWNYSSYYCRSACRFFLDPLFTDYYIGFRVVCAPIR